MRKREQCDNVNLEKETNRDRQKEMTEGDREKERKKAICLHQPQ